MERGTGLGVYCKSNATKVTLSLGNYTTVWQAEVCAVMTCAMIYLEKGKSGKRINICVDSQAALNALSNPTVESKLVWECRKVLDELGLKNKLSLIWVPEHSGIRGNEEADTLARRGSEIMPGAVKEAIRRWSRRCHEREWAETTVGRQAKALLGLKLNRGFAESFLKLNKIRVREVVRLLTGHGLLNYHQHKIGRNVSPRCGLCNAEEEFSTHILCHCPAYAAARHQCWGHAFVDPDRIRDLSVQELLDFWNKTVL
ncbi:uncharacterized protein LOC127287978 [Leptopilina boulardi]|uniref:uncharacterized protein LOC127287977 n=1 Tax=Leptopilina boulardi TaxID=63433 RepID=UPI0021F5A162|nr:uncharacterized protein LOC127287977 [Leptopilina boulardi]XP_051171102.1 uncharacterized protein LOC127287978 [Leptopilina boulardi]